MTRDPAAEAPRVLNDRYEVLRPLGHGGMGAVYLVFDRQERRRVALKSFPPTARRVEDLAHFEHEFLTLSRLRHPHVAEVYDFGVIEGSQDVFFTSEWIDGTDLFAVSDGLPEPELVRLLVQVCRGLEYIHSRQIIHYDVKPTNILVAGGRAKLIDFGLAAQQVEEALGVIKGTVSYLAPEVARHLPVDHRADLYSLGVTVFHCVTRRLPFRGETNLDVVRRLVSDHPPDPRELCAVTDGLAEVILRLLSKDPGARYPSGNDLIQALAGVTGERFDLEPREAALPFVATGGFIGREEESAALARAFDRIFSWREPDDPVARLPQVQPPGATPGSTGFVVTTSGGLVLELDSGSRASSRLGRRAAPPRAEEAPRSSEVATSSFAPQPAPPAPEPVVAGEVPGAPLRHVFLVRGELGMGKSRLLREFKTYAQLRRVQVVEGRAAATGRSYDAFVQVFRGLLGLWDGGAGEEPPRPEAGERPGTEAPLRPQQSDQLRRRLLGRYGPELVRLFPELDRSVLPSTPRVPLAPEQEQVRLLDALAQFLVGYGRGRPLVVLLHDLEQADQETLALLHYLVRNLSLVESGRELRRRAGEEDPRTLRLMVVATYRPSEVEGRPQAGVLGAIAGEPVAETLVLGPLTQEGVYTLVESMLGAGSEPRTLARRLWQETRGNPYFTVELLRALVEAGRLRQESGRWVARLDDPSALAMPENVTSALLERLSRCAPAERAPLQLLAVLGRPAAIHELTALSGQDARALVPILDALEKRQVLAAEHQEAGRRYDFIHGVARDALYGEIEPEQRLALHAACGEWLEKRAALGGVDPGELVRHFSAAGDRARALEYGIRAGDEARAVHSNHKAIEFYRGALALLPTGSARWRDLLQRTGDLLALVGDYDPAVEAYARLLAPDLVGRLQPAERLRAVRRRGEILAARGDFDGALEVLSAGAASVYGQDGLEREAALLFAAAAGIYLQAGRYADAVGFCEAALGQLVGVPEAEEAAQARMVLGRARLAQGETAQAEAELERCLAIRRHLGDEAGIARALADLGAVALETGRLEEAQNRFERALERESALGHAAGVAEAATRLARTARLLGEQDRALALLRRALAIHEQTGTRGDGVNARVDLARIHLGMAEYEAAREALRLAREESARLGLAAQASRAANGEAQLLLALGDEARATELANEALRLAGDLPRQRAAALETLGRIELRGGGGREVDPDAAELLLHQAQALYRAQKDRGAVTRTTLAVQELLLARGDEPLLRASLEGLEPDLPRLDQARVLHLRVRAALRFDPGGGRGAAPSGAERPQRAHLGDLERAAAIAERHRDLELSWRIAWTRGRLLERLGEEESALAAYVEAMSGIRDLIGRVPPEHRASYVAHPDCVTCKEEFARLRASVS